MTGSCLGRCEQELPIEIDAAKATNHQSPAPPA